MSRNNPETLNLVMDYAALMEACAAYVAVRRPAVRDPEAAASAAKLMIEYAASNPEGGELMAPPEVMALVPEHLQKIEATK